MKNHHDDALKLASARAVSITLEEDLMECPECGEKFLRYADEEDDLKCECYFCGYSDDSNNVAKRYIENILHICEHETVNDGEKFPLYECLLCEHKSMVKTNDFYFCFNCGMKFELKDLQNCISCGKLFLGVDNETFCSNCAKSLSDKTSEKSDELVD